MTAIAQGSLLTDECDTSLIDAARRGDDAAIAALYRRYNSPAEARLRRELYGSGLEPRDITHQAWADVIQGIRSGRQIENLPAYLSKVIQRNLAEQQTRRTESLERLLDDGRPPAAMKTDSAESSFYDQSLALITNSLRRPECDPRSEYATTVESAAAIAQLHGFDTPLTPPRNATRRKLVETVDQVDAYDEVAAAIKAQIALVSKASIPPPYDPEMAGMFAGWSVPDLEALLMLPVRHLLCLVDGAVAFPSKPAEPHRRILRAKLAGLSDTAGWTKTIRALEKSWVAEWFTSIAWRDRSSDPLIAEAERVAAASLWESAATAAIVFPGQPLGRNITTHADVHQRLYRMLYSRR